MHSPPTPTPIHPTAQTKFYYLDAVAMISCFVIQIVGSKTFAAWYYKYESDETTINRWKAALEANNALALADDTDKTTDGLQIGNMVTLLCMTMVVLYPIFVMPLYRSEATSDLARMLWVIICHPIIQEVFMTISRTGKAERLVPIVNDKSRCKWWQVRVGGWGEGRGLIVTC